MKPERWRQIETVVQSALEQEPWQRAAFLEEACAGDELLRREVEALIASQEQAESFSDGSPLGAVAERIADRKVRSIAGRSIGPYRNLTPLATGGMGEVYQARDAKLGRDVAIKVLPRDFSSDPQRVRRFKREARAASALNHPNIITIHEIGKIDSVYYIVMELVEGKTLREALRSGPLPTSKMLNLTSQIADGLAKAHAAGITHRDLKPENLMVTKDGFVKILDFGLAKVTQPEIGGAEVESRVTEPGTILGTVGYMSPEQARGDALDYRSDQFSLGAIAYEMLTGKRAFERGTPVETLSAIMRDEPQSIVEINPKAHAPARWVVERCLAKDPEDRYASTRDLARQLQTIREHLTEEVSQGAAPRLARLRSRERFAWITAGVLFFVAAVVVGAVYLHRGSTDDVRPVRFFVSPPERVAFTSLDGPAAISPEGRCLVFAATSSEGKKSLWVRSFDSLTAKAIPGTDDAYLPFWSPDSSYIGFFAQGKVKKIKVSGGPPETLCDAATGRGGTWNRDGVILFSPRNRDALYRVSDKGGPVTPVTTLDQEHQENSHRWPQFLPDGRHFTYLTRSARHENGGIYLGSLDSKDTKRLLGSDSGAAYASPGYLLFVRAGALLAQPFDGTRLQLKGEPVLVAEEVAYEASGYRPEFSVSESGVLAYRQVSVSRSQLTWFDRTGTQLGSLGPPDDYRVPCLSGDQKRVAIDRFDPHTGTRDIWVLELERGSSTRLTFDPANDKDPVWSPDGRRIIFASSRHGPDYLYQKSSSGPGDEELILESNGSNYPCDWSPDGRYVIYNNWDPKTKWDLWVLPLFGDRKPIPFLKTEFDEAQAHFSPNGRWVAYTSNDSGITEVYVQSFPPSGGRLQISAKGGGDPSWSRDGKELFYIAGNVMAVTVKTDSSTFEAGVPRKLFEPRLNVSTAARNQYVVTADGQRFLVNMVVEQATYPPITVVLNWIEGLRR
jgi:serine/threonine protein kinase/Tol biopolymer transport system component